MSAAANSYGDVSCARTHLTHASQLNMEKDTRVRNRRCVFPPQPCSVVPSSPGSVSALSTAS